LPRGLLRLTIWFRGWILNKVWRLISLQCVDIVPDLIQEKFCF
jgi:hypothetical protein